MSKTHRQYFNELAPEWHLKMPEDPLIEEQLQLFGIRPKDRVLDVGSGSGRLARPLAGMVGKNGLVLAQDIAERMLHQGKSLTQENVLWVCGDIHTLSLKHDSFDKAICFSSFPHFHNPVTALTEIHRVLRPGGKILIFHLDSSSALNAFHASLKEPVCRDRLPDSKTMKTLLASAGFSMIQITDKEKLYLARGQKSCSNRKP
jgi:ubiquinone/menaquinone biosynthesis C-methylase UbiE